MRIVRIERMSVYREREHASMGCERMEMWMLDASMCVVRVDLCVRICVRVRACVQGCSYGPYVLWMAVLSKSLSRGSSTVKRSTSLFFVNCYIIEQSWKSGGTAC